ncbi:MAG: hypothetical protein ACI9R3_003029, partial [Verrucomicrobiales bacterium]
MKTIFSILSITLASIAFNASAQTYIYDDAGRLGKLLYDNGKGVAYTYDVRDNLTQINKIAVPPAVTNLAVSVISSTAATLSWQHTGDVALYLIQSRIVGTDDWVNGASVDNVNARSAAITLTPGVERTYRIVVLGNNSDESAPSGEIEIPSQVPLLVTTLEDENDLVLGQGVGDSLREVIAVAVAGETIEFAPYLTGGNILLKNGEFTVTKSIIIDGSALPERITINADAAGRAFSISGAEAVTIKGLRMRNGKADDGGAVRSTDSILMLDECVIVGNEATQRGGGVCSLGTGILILSDTTILGNTATTQGGGIFNASGVYLEIVFSSVSSNFADAGGGLFNNGVSTLVDRSGFWENSALVNGGGILNLGIDVLIENCTIASNSSAQGSGGGITNDDGGNLTIRHSTIAANTGKGIVNNAQATLVLDNSIVGSNFNLLNSPLDVEGDYTAVGANIVRVQSGSRLGGPVALKGDPLLGPLAYYGARSKNMPLQVGSPALDAGTITANTPSTDQASAFRPNGAGPDLGSIESRLSSETNLEWLTTSAGLLSPVFRSSTTSYTAKISNETTTVAFRPAKLQFGQTVEIRINGGGYAEVESKDASSDLPLVAGENTVEVKVTAQNGNSTKTYAITVVRGTANATNTDLATLTTSAGTLSPSFDPATSSYNSVVSESTVTTTVTAMLANTDATMEVRVNFGNYVALASGATSSPLALDVGPNAIDIKVTAKDGATTTVHALTVTRESPATSNALLAALSASAGSLSPNFSRGVFVYNIEVSSDVTSTSVTATTARLSASIKARINGGSFAAISSGATSSQMTLAAGANLIEVNVTAQNGTTLQSYTIIVTRIIETVDWISESGDADSTKPSMSADCRFIAFASRARNLIPGGTNNNEHIFVYDRIADTMKLISESDSGQQGDRNSTDPAISADGLFVAFQSEARNLVPGDENGGNDPSSGRDIFVYDMTQETIERVSLRDNGGESNQASGNPSISGDGRFVAFESSANNLVSGYAVGNTNVYIRDRTENTIIGIPVPFADILTNRDSLNPAISSDGAHVAFEFSVDRNDDNQDLNYRYTDIYLYGTGGALDQKRGTIERISGTKIGTEAEGTKSQAPSISADGRYIAFESNLEDIDFYDTNKAIDVFVYDRKTGTTRRVSANGATGGQIFKDSTDPSISGDGRYVAFESMASNLVPSDTNNAIDIFMTDLATGEITLASVNADGVQGNDYSYLPSLSYDGKCMAFQSAATNMVPGDVNSDDDIFVVETEAIDPSPLADLASLTSNLGALSPGFSPSVLSYSVSIPVGQDTATVRPVAAVSGATIEGQVNGGQFIPLPFAGDFVFPLDSGENTLKFQIKAPGATVKTYSLSFTRFDPVPVLSDDADLANLVPGVGVLSPAFPSSELIYTVTVSNTTELMLLTPTVANSSASVTVNDVAVASGATSAAFNLSVGSNTLFVKVTAEDGVSTKTYVVSVTREPGSNASLASLVPGAGTLSPGFAGDTLAYGITVPNTITSMTLTPTVADPNASVTVNEVVVASGATSAAVNLSIGSNTLSVKVTAED